MTEKLNNLGEWARWAYAQTAGLRHRVELNCFPFHHWPILVKDFQTFLPIDVVPRRPAANDNESRD